MEKEKEKEKIRGSSVQSNTGITQQIRVPSDHIPFNAIKCARKYTLALGQLKFTPSQRMNVLHEGWMWVHLIERRLFGHFKHSLVNRTIVASCDQEINRQAKSH